MSRPTERRIEREHVMRKEETKRLVVKRETEIEEEFVNKDKEEDCNCSCRQMWRDYRSCVEFFFLGCYQCMKSIRNGIYHCFGACCFPIKERFCNCCDDIDRDLNPYKNPNYNPYDYL